ncbi:MAG: GNAT family N-acetyltransferase [Chloroflexi bacterium]|nr:GNAT family N-acetyltransferase [Chloroflexota bacterium]
MIAVPTGRQGFPCDDVIVRSRKTVVRRKRMADAADEYAWRSDEELARFDASNPTRVPFPDYQRNWSFDMRFTDTAGRSFAVEDENGQHIGNIMYYNIDTLRQEAELGITIGDQQFWGQGYGSEAVRLLVEHLLARMGFQRIHLKTLTWNRRAQRCFEKAGFVECGQTERGGNMFILMELLQDWLPTPVDGGP